MIIINIFIALIIAIGFWRNTSKEHKRKIAKASFTKTFILFLLSAAMIFFYYKSYQVATFKNWVVVKGIKGSYSNKNDTMITNGDTIIYNKNDRIWLLSILSKFTHNVLYYKEPFLINWDSIQSGGIRAYFQLSHNKGNTRWYPNITKKDTLTINFKNRDHLYNVKYLTNSIPNFIPLAYYDDYSIIKDSVEVNEGDFFDLKSSATKISKKFDEIGKDYDIIFAATIASLKNCKAGDNSFIQYRTNSKNVNTLNFFSAADLSQCQYQVSIKSDIPIDILGMYFDLPIEVPSLDVIKHHVSSKGFYLIPNNEGKNLLLDLHVKFPTLANLQLIRSLILTTLLTALLSLFFKNLYYYCRKLFERRIRNQETPFTYSRKMVLLWIPVGKIIVWTFIVAFAFLLILSILNFHFRINVVSITKFKILITACILLYVLLVCCVFSFLYKRKILVGDLIHKLLYKPVESENGNKDVKPSPEADEKPEETSKTEDSIINDNTNQEDGQKPSRQPSRPKKRKSRKRRR